jgi:heme exporter protein D
MIWRYLLYAFLIYLAYRFIFHFIIPIYKTTKQVKKQFREMHSRMEDQMNQQQANQQTATPQPENKKQQVGGDYIDFEELK